MFPPLIFSGKYVEIIETSHVRGLRLSAAAYGGTPCHAHRGAVLVSADRGQLRAVPAVLRLLPADRPLHPPLGARAGLLIEKISV